MSFKIIYTESYNKRASKFLKKYPDLISQYEKMLKILEKNPVHPSLRLHQLKGKLKDLHSISINISYRITLEFYIADKEIVLVNIGRHDDIY
jgi:mRNA-degrading endonuclease YafQ of YafQ-DinJ toxin-antitoxin module